MLPFDPRHHNSLFSPHLTLIQDFSVDQVPAAMQVIRSFNPHYQFEVTEVALAGRRGGKVWEPLVTFRLGTGETVQGSESVRP